MARYLLQPGYEWDVDTGGYLFISADALARRHGVDMADCIVDRGYFDFVVPIGVIVLTTVRDNDRANTRPDNRRRKAR